MKKRAIICILLVLAFAMSMVSVTAFAATTPSAGTFKVNGANVTKSDDTYYYVNKTFTYTPATDATGYFYAEVSKEDIATLDAGTLFNGGSAVKDSVPTVDTESASVTYYAFADYYTADATTTFSSIAILVVDTEAPVIDEAGIKAWVTNSANEGAFPNSWVEATDEFVLPTGWLSDTKYVTESTAVVEEEGGTTVNNTKMLNVRFEYRKSGEALDGEWTSETESIDLTETGHWKFRFVVADEAGNEVTFTTEANYLEFDVRDTAAPEIELTSTQKKVETSGTPAGTAYTIPTPTYTDLAGVEKSYYIVYKLVNGEYVAIFNSDTKEVTKGYDNFITDAGVLTPGSNEVSTTVDGQPQYIYKVVYHAQDKNGMTNELELKILTTKADPTTEAFDSWKIVLICVAVACAVAIVVLIFVKPRPKAERKPTDRQ